MESNGNTPGLGREIKWYENVALQDKSYSATVYYGVQSETRSDDLGKNIPWAIGYSSLDPTASISHNFSNTNTSAIADMITPFVNMAHNFGKGFIEQSHDEAYALNTIADMLRGVTKQDLGVFLGNREALSTGPYSEMQLNGPLGTLFRTFRQTNISIPVPEISILLSYQSRGDIHPFLSYASELGYGESSLMYPIDQLKFLLLESISANAIKNNFSIGNLKTESVTKFDRELLSSKVATEDKATAQQLSEIENLDETLTMVQYGIRNETMDWGAYHKNVAAIHNEIYMTLLQVENKESFLSRLGVANHEYDTLTLYEQDFESAKITLSYLEWAVELRNAAAHFLEDSDDYDLNGIKRIGIIGDSFITQSVVGQISPYNFRKINTTEFPAEYPGNFSIKYKDVWYKNLIITNISISFSKEMLPNSRIVSKGGKAVLAAGGPAFIVVKLKFEPAIKQEHRMLLNFLEIGDGLTSSDFDSRKTTVSQIDLKEWLTGMIQEIQNSGSQNSGAMKNAMGAAFDAGGAAMEMLSQFLGGL